MGIVIFVVLEIATSIDRKNEEKQKEIDREIDEAEKVFNDGKTDFNISLYIYFQDEQDTIKSYTTTYSMLVDSLSNMEKGNRDLIRLSKKDDHSEMIRNYAKVLYDFRSFGEGIISAFGEVYRCSNTSRMMNSSNYGLIHNAYYDSVRSMNKNMVDAYIANCDENINPRKYSQIFLMDVEKVLRCIWFYAMDKPYSVQSFKRAVKVFNCLFLTSNSHIDVTIAELYAMKQMGGEKILLDRIHDILKSEYDAERLTIIASSLMWMSAYQAENVVLQHMLRNEMQMSAKVQERLHFLSTGTGKTPIGFNVISNNSELYFDVSALTWKDDDYIGLFENLSFQEKPLSYSLAVRDDDKDLLITNGINVPGIDQILAKLSSVFVEEYGTVVTAKLKKCVALSGSSKENMEGIFIESEECKQMGILVQVARIGKKYNIKFYTLFMPYKIRLTDQKQQALSLRNKLSPFITMWESSIKDTVLMAIQQILNTNVQTSYKNKENSSTNYDEPIF